MKFQRSTVILVGVALLLGAGVLIAESQRARTPETAEVSQGSEPIFDFAETEVASLTVERSGETLTFEQDGEGNWQMTAPQTSLAEPGAVAFLLSRLNTDSPLQTVTMAADQTADFGLDNPQGTVTVTLQDGTVHTLILGGPDFSGNANYAVIDPPAWPPTVDSEAYNVLVVSRDVANGINRPLEEWKMPGDVLPEETSPEQSEDLEEEGADPNQPEASEEEGATSEQPEASPAQPEAAEDGEAPEAEGSP